MEHHDNEQRLRILQERLRQITNKQEASQEQQPRAEKATTYPTYNPNTTKSIKGARFEVYTDVKGEYRFRLKAPNGEIIAASEGYTAKHNCLNGIKSVKENSSIAVIEEIEEIKESLSYPDYNPKATQSSDEDIAPQQKEKEKTPSTFPWKIIFTLLILLRLQPNFFF